MIPDAVTAHDKDGDPILILFRQLNAPVPSGWKPGMHWQVEAYETATDYPSAPVGLCWVLDPAENLPPDRRHEAYLPASIEDLLVADGWRRRGIASALLDVCRRRWPNLHVIEPSAEAGVAFLTTYLARASLDGAAGAAFADETRRMLGWGADEPDHPAAAREAG